jgi:hypothetical protein
MTSPLPLSLTPLHPKYQARCRRANIFNVHQLVLIPPAELANLLGLGVEETLREVLDVVLAGCVPRCLCLGAGRRRPAARENEGSEGGKGKGKERQENPELSDALSFSCGSQRYHISSGDAGLDAVLGGGIRTGILTEIVGER